MINCQCIIQENQIPLNVQEQLREHLTAFSKDAFGKLLDIEWIIVPSGSGFTAAKPSTSALVLVTAPEPVEQKRRILLLNQLCDIWMKTTHCSLNEIVAVIADPAEN